MGGRSRIQAAAVSAKKAVDPIQVIPAFQPLTSPRVLPLQLQITYISTKRFDSAVQAHRERTPDKRADDAVFC